MGRLTDLHQKLTQFYTLDELQTLCAKLDVPYDHLSGDALPARAMSLLKYCDKRNTLPAFVAQTQRDFPNVDWPLPAQPKLYFYFGERMVPFIPLALVLIGLVAAGVFAYLQLRGPVQMTGTFNVVVAQFGELGPDGAAKRNDSGYALSVWVYQTLYNELFVNEPSAQLWHDSLPFGRKAVTIGVIQGRTAEERAANAAKLAAELQADVVIYGNIDGAQGALAPEFYVKALRSEADEIAGKYELGALIDVQLPFRLDDPAAKRAVGDQLQERTRILTRFTRGLLDDLTGDHPGALQQFSQLRTAFVLPAAVTRVVNYFIGRQNLLLARNDTQAARIGATITQTLDAAEVAFLAALAPGERYSRGQLGLGNVALRRGERLLLKPGTTPSDLQQAMAHLDTAVTRFQSALEIAAAESDATLMFRAQSSLGNAHRLQARRFLLEANYAQAAPLYAQAVDELKVALGQSEGFPVRNRAITQLNLGIAYQESGHLRFVQNDRARAKPLFESARESFAACLKLADEDRYDATLKDIKTGQCQRYLDDVTQVLATL